MLYAPTRYQLITRGDFENKKKTDLCNTLLVV